MVTNALSPMRVIDALQDLVTPSGLIGAMSSGQGSITNNTNGLREVYRGSKAALNMFMRASPPTRPTPSAPSCSSRPAGSAPSLGGDDAPFTIEETIPTSSTC